MSATIHRAAIVGGSSLLGKEVAEELNQAGGALWDLALLDVAESAGQVTAAGDEPLLIQPLTQDSFQGADIVFFAADAETTREHWKHAVAAGAGVVDLTGALALQDGVGVRAPLLSLVGLDEQRLNLSTEAVAAAHAASLMLGYVGLRLRSMLEEGAVLSATVLVPASEQGKEAMDELHAQTVALLSFQTLPRDLYDAQVTFNVNAEFGESARISLQEVPRRMRSELQALFGREAAARYAFQCLQAPVFHACCASIFLQLRERVEERRWPKRWNIHHSLPLCKRVKLHRATRPLPSRRPCWPVFVRRRPKQPAAACGSG